MKSSDQQIWFNIAATDGLGPAAGQKIARYLASHQLPVDALLDHTIEQLKSIGLTVGVAHALHQQLQDLVTLPDQLSEIELATPGEDHYPNARLESADPPLPLVMWSTADTGLLRASSPTIAIAGSRETTEDFLELVYDFATHASRQGWLIVSGLAAGVDSAGHQGGLDGGTGTIGVLASGITNTSRNWTADTADGICYVSQFAPTDPWSGPRAMQRNSTIAALADRVFVAVADTTGGSWEMAQLCLKRKKQLFVLDVPSDIAPGNQKLIRSGATPLDPANTKAAIAAPPPPSPLTLFG
jgi:DNA processing protein